MMTNYQELTQKYKLSEGAIKTLERAIRDGNGKAAQFNHPELGGMGQWMPGMVMIGDMMNHSLKARVQELCEQLAETYQPTSPTITQNQWWPADLGQPNASGKQNDSHYAYFSGSGSLAIMRNSTIKIYDVSGYRITGVSQQQSNNRENLSFNTDKGVISESDLQER